MFLKFYAVFLPNICDVDLDGDIMETVQSEAVTILQFGASAVDGYIEDINTRWVDQTSPL